MAGVLRRGGATDDPITVALTPRFATIDITAARVRTDVRTIETERVVDAPPEAVWAVLTDFSAYSEWNPFIPRIEGVPREGEQLRVRIEPPESRGATFRPEVQAAEPNRRLAWLGHLFVPHLFDGHHEFRLEPLDGGERTRFVQRETLGGVLVPFLLDADAVRQGFEAMNGALAERAEATATVGR